MYLLILLSAIVIFSSILFYYAKNTFLSPSMHGGGLWSLLFYKEVVFILVPVFLLSVYPVSSFYSLKMVKQEMVNEISILIVFTLFIFLSLFISFIKLFNSKKIFFFNTTFFCDLDFNRQVRIFSRGAVLLGGGLLVVSMIFLGYEHAFVSSIINGVNVLHVRLSNTYNSGLPTQVSYIISVSSWISAIYCSFLLFNGEKIKAILYFFVGAALVTASGDKAPILEYIILIVTSYIIFFRPKMNFIKIALYTPFYFTSLLFLLYYAVSLQIEDLNFSSFIIYLFERAGIGQVAGVYEALSIDFKNPDFFWHSVPFASLFLDYPIFSKELMLYTEGANYDATGVKNSYFIAESNGIGGINFMLFSPLLMAVAYFIKAFLICTFLKILGGEGVQKLYTLPLLFLSTRLTGDLSPMLFQKGTILLLIILSCIILFSWVLNLLFPVRLNIRNT